MQLIELFLPLYDNAGQPFARAAFDAVRDELAHVFGGVTAFGLPDGLPVWVDAAVMERPRIVLGGGSRSWKVLAPPAILRTLPNVEIVDGLAAPRPD